MGRCVLLLCWVACVGPAEIDPPSCASCHGQPGNAAPPSALGGDEDGPAVGAHQAHVAPTFSVPVACEECHLVPSSLNAPGHIDTPVPAEVMWGPIASLAGAEPFDGTERTCTVYCHGAAFADPSREVGWNDGPDAASCASCHGFPPAAPHPDDETCANCHPRPAPDSHLDGTLQLGRAE